MLWTLMWCQANHSTCQCELSSNLYPQATLISQLSVTEWLMADQRYMEQHCLMISCCHPSTETESSNNDAMGDAWGRRLADHWNPQARFPKWRSLGVREPNCAIQPGARRWFLSLILASEQEDRWSSNINWGKRAVVKLGGQQHGLWDRESSVTSSEEFINKKMPLRLAPQQNLRSVPCLLPFAGGA